MVVRYAQSRKGLEPAENLGCSEAATSSANPTNTNDAHDATFIACDARTPIYLERMDVGGEVFPIEQRPDGQIQLPLVLVLVLDVDGVIPSKV